MIFKAEYLCSSIILTFVILLAVFDSIIWSIIVCILYIVGYTCSDRAFKYIGTILKKYGQKSVDNNLNSNKSCKVCGGSNCNRHRTSVYNTSVKVPRDFDLALQMLLEQVVQTYVVSWYSFISSNEEFLQQIRLTIAIAIRNIASRLLQIQMSHLICDNLIPIALQHAQDFKILSEHAQKKGGKPEDYAVDYLGHRIHPAAYSREKELNYLRGLVAGLLPYLLPSTYLSTNTKILFREILANWVLLPAMDALADPENLNFLIKLGTQCEEFSIENIDSGSVPILQAWVTPVIKVPPPKSPWKPSLDQVLNDPDLLYLFMQHIKETGPVNLLQFCLDIDDLSKRILNPDMTKEIEENLYIDAQNIYSTYLNPESSDYVSLPWHISQGMQQILEGGPTKIQELRTSKPLYEAHHEAHALLESICLPSFHHSSKLYKRLCGSPVPSSNFTKTSSQSGSQSGTGAGVGSRISNQLGRLRGALRATPVDGATYKTPDVFQAEEVDCAPRTFQDVNFCADECIRDLTTWRVTVPHVDGGGSHPLYMVAIHSVSENKSWTVLRRDQDFYNLRARLMEFHGDREMNDSPLPTRKNQNTSLAANRQRYEDFLQKLLVKPTLRSSELLHTFLTVPDLKPYLTSYSTPDIGVLCQSVAHKLRKEKGQHLDKFMKTFLASTIGENDQVNVGVDPINDHDFAESMKKGPDLFAGPFNNNLNIGDINLTFCPLKKQHVTGVCFCFAEAVDSLLNISSSTSTFLWLTTSLCRSALDPICNKFLDDTLAKLLSGGRAAAVVKLLHNAIFSMKTSKKIVSTAIKDDERYKSAREGLHSLMPKWFIGLRTNYCKLMDALLNPLQNAPLNKHLSYLLVDQLVYALFPELSQED